MVTPFDPKTAMPRLAEIEPENVRTEEAAYVTREVSIAELLENTQNDRGPRLEGYAQDGSSEEGLASSLTCCGVLRPVRYPTGSVNHTLFEL